MSARTGDGVDALVDHLVGRLPEGPPYYPADVVADVPDATRVAELVREQLLAVTHDELPYSIATQVTEWEWPRIRVEILVERDSQKGMVIGKGGAVLKQAGTAARSSSRPAPTSSCSSPSTRTGSTAPTASSGCTEIVLTDLSSWIVPAAVHENVTAVDNGVGAHAVAACMSSSSNTTDEPRHLAAHVRAGHVTGTSSSRSAVPAKRSRSSRSA